MNYGATAAVLNGIIDGSEAVRTRKEKQLYGEQQKAKFAQQQRLANTNQESAEAKLQETQLKLAELEKSIKLKDIYKTMKEKSLTNFSAILKGDRNMQNTLDGAVQVVSFDPTDKSPANVALYKSKKIPEGHETVVGILPDGSKKLIDWTDYKIRNGYASVEAKEKLAMENAKYQQDKLKSEIMKNKSIAVKNNRGTKEQYGQFQKQIETFKRNKPNATKEELDRYIDKVMKKSVLGVASNRKDKENTELVNSQIEAIKLVNSKDYDKEKAIGLETVILGDLDSTKKQSVKKAIKDMTANHSIVTNVNRILKEADSGTVKVDKDAVSNVHTYINKIFGNATPQALKNVDFNTASGLILARFMKDMSGTAVGREEAERLSNLFQGGDLADEKFVKEAMRKFAKEAEESNIILKNNNAQYLPDTAIKLTTYGEGYGTNNTNASTTNPSNDQPTNNDSNDGNVKEYNGKKYKQLPNGDWIEVK